MKKRDIIYVIVAAAIFLVAGYLVYTQLAPKSASSGSGTGTEVEIVGQIDSSFDSSNLATLTDGTKVKDFAVILNLTTGLNNTAPFGK